MSFIESYLLHYIYLNFKEHMHWIGEFNSFRICKTQHFVVIQYGVHVFNPKSIYRSVTHNPFVVWCGVLVKYIVLVSNIMIYAWKKMWKVRSSFEANFVNMWKIWIREYIKNNYFGPSKLSLRLTWPVVLLLIGFLGILKQRLYLYSMTNTYCHQTIFPFKSQFVFFTIQFPHCYALWIEDITENKMFIMYWIDGNIYTRTLFYVFTSWYSGLSCPFLCRVASVSASNL